MKPAATVMGYHPGNAGKMTEKDCPPMHSGIGYHCKCRIASILIDLDCNRSNEHMTSDYQFQCQNNTDIAILQPLSWSDFPLKKRQPVPSLCNE